MTDSDAPAGPQWFAPGAKARDGSLSLQRRGIDHGRVHAGSAAPAEGGVIATRWAEGEAVLLPGLASAVVQSARSAIRESLATFERLREGDSFLDEIDARLGDDEYFRYAGSTVDHADAREIERLFVDVPGDKDHKRVRDLTARLSWIAHDENDTSLRIRFSFGHESTRDWLTPDRHAAWSDRFAERTFPENAALRRLPALRQTLDSLLAQPWRLSELIVYSNAPGGGAVFHHDADPGQRGVVYAQLDGNTVWLACPRRALAATAARIGDLDADAVFRRMEDDGDQSLWTLLNATPALTGALAAQGRLFVLQPGDVLLLPSRSAEECCWHSVFGVGRKPSLAHSMAIFDALPDELIDPRLRDA
ncbi:MAG: hypothetical protein U1F36_08895 [Planctomycetota bacterium]